MISKLSENGVAGFVLANGSMSTNTNSEGQIRQKIIENDLVDCMIALPGQLFFTTQIPVCLWFISRNKKADAGRGFRDRQGETLFIDARKMGTLVDRVHRDLSDDEIAEIARTYHAWRGEAEAGDYEDKAGFCKSATLEEIKTHQYVLTPGRYVGATFLPRRSMIGFSSTMTSAILAAIMPASRKAWSTRSKGCLRLRVSVACCQKTKAT